jgi:SAM-dependent methyltransferase
MVAMKREGSVEVWRLYEAKAAEFDNARRSFAGEDRYLREIAARLPAGAAVLDLGCGTGRPIAAFFIDRGYALTGIDAAPAMIAICRSRFPKATWMVGDMRKVALRKSFKAIVAWDSFFHLPPDDQRAMFPVFGAHCEPGALLLFTAGPDAGEPVGDLFGSPLYHASLTPDEYRALLHDNGFAVVRYAPEDPDCGGHTVWLAQRLGSEAGPR